MVTKKNLILAFLCITFSITTFWLVYFTFFEMEFHNYFRSLVLKKTKSFSKLPEKDIENGCRRSLNFNENPIILGGHSSVVDILNPDTSVGGTFNCPNIPCYLKNMDLVENKPDHYKVDAFLGYHIPYRSIKKYKVCKNQQFAYYSWEAWKVDPFTFWMNWDFIVAPFSHSDVPVRYFQHDLFKKPEAKTEKALVSSFISNCEFKVKSGRNEIILMLNDELKKLGHGMDLFGRCFEKLNKNLEVPGESDRDKIKQKVMRRYKFNLAFENNLDDGYLSEKYWQAFQEGTVPSKSIM